MAHGEELQRLGWLGGSVIPEALYAAVLPSLRHGSDPPLADLAEADWAIVVTQSCDLLAKKDDSEPFVEIVIARPTGKQPREGFRDLQSTRFLDFRPNRKDHPGIVLTAHATKDRYFVPRRLLVAAAPRADRSLSENSVKRLQQWIALRATRPAWPDNFVGRIQAVGDDLKKALANLHETVAEVRVAISPPDRELEGGVPYRISVFFIVPAELYGEPEVRRSAQEGFASFVSTLQKCPGIEVDEDLSAVSSGEEFTWQETQSTDLWNFASLSNRDE